MVLELMIIWVFWLVIIVHMAHGGRSWYPLFVIPVFLSIFTYLVYVFSDIFSLLLVVIIHLLLLIKIFFFKKTCPQKELPRMTERELKNTLNKKGK